MIGTTNQLIVNIWSCLVLSAPIIAIGCFVYMHKVIFGNEPGVTYLDAETAKANRSFQRNGTILPERINRKMAAGRRVKTLSVSPSHAKDPHPAQLPSEPLDFADKLGTLYQREQTSHCEKSNSQGTGYPEPKVVGSDDTPYLNR